VMVMGLRRRKHPRLEARVGEALLPAHVAAVMVATLAHMPSKGSFPFARRLSLPGHWKVNQNRCPERTGAPVHEQPPRSVREMFLSADCGGGLLGVPAPVGADNPARTADLVSRAGCGAIGLQ
jgi:hypothetical protein